MAKLLSKHGPGCHSVRSGNKVEMQVIVTENGQPVENWPVFFSSRRPEYAELGEATRPQDFVATDEYGVATMPVTILTPANGRSFQVKAWTKTGNDEDTSTTWYTFNAQP